MDTLLKSYERDLALKGFSPKTQKTYYRNLVWFLNHTQLDPHDITRETIKDYLYYLIRDKKLSESSLRQARCAIQYFFSQTLAKPVEVANIPALKKSKKLPTVLSVNETAQIISSAHNIKHKTMLMLAYSSGLRVGELVNLKITDIHRNTMRISVRQAKGRKDRYVILSSVCLAQLEKYWKAYRPAEWLFYGYRENQPISIRAVQHAYEDAKKRAGIARGRGIHTLRHSFATHMLESGSGIFQLQKFLGHRHLKTTLVYAHISEENIIARSPLDVYADKFTDESSNA
ncbi:MAG TPA: site-specific integrase [Methylomicrobium sp.]|nr:site-specific integrase [Methylomicrobium sp.]